MWISFILLGLCSVIEVFVCHFTLWWVLAIIARLLFSLRIVGATFKVKRLAITEGIAVACMIVWNMIFAKGHIPWLRIGIFLLFAIVSCVIMIVDDFYFVHVTLDEEED